MLNTKKTINNGSMTIVLSGRLDTTTAPELDSELKGSLDGINEVTLDMKELDYISSAGLRVLLSVQKIMNRQGSMKLINVNKTVTEIFEVTGFSDILTIE